MVATLQILWAWRKETVALLDLGAQRGGDHTNGSLDRCPPAFIGIILGAGRHSQLNSVNMKCRLLTAPVHSHSAQDPLAMRTKTLSTYFAPSVHSCSLHFKWWRWEVQLVFSILWFQIWQQLLSALLCFVFCFFFGWWGSLPHLHFSKNRL